MKYWEVINFKKCLTTVLQVNVNQKIKILFHLHQNGSYQEKKDFFYFITKKVVNFSNYKKCFRHNKDSI